MPRRQRGVSGRAGPIIVALLMLVLCAAVRAEGVRDSETNALLEIRTVIVDGTLVSLHPGEKLRLPPQNRTVTFGFGPATNATRPPMRVRFKLDGYDDRWRESAAEMRLCVRFLDGNGDQVGEPVFRIVGQSEGWTGAPETAAYRHRRETIVAPPRARRYWVVISSAGPPATLGAYAITNLVVYQHPSNNIPPVMALPWAFDPAATSGFPSGVPVGWMRDGLRPSMARVIECLPTRIPGLAIVDDDLNGHAEWHTVKERAVAVTPGDHLEIEWDEAYSFGLSGPVEISYPGLPAGYYRFRVNELSVLGVPGEAESSLALEVPLVFWRTPWFWISLLTMLLASAAGAWRIAVWRKLQLRLQRLEQQRAVDRERLRIAQDIHDDLGARVTQISLLSAVAQGKPSLPDDARADFGTISQTTRELVSALYETVWAVNPENDNLDALANYLCQMGNQLCSQAQLRCRLEVPDLPAQVALSSQVRHHLIMAVKEALHNVIKHARASEVRIRITFTAARKEVRVPSSGSTGAVLHICIQDDGCGFEVASKLPGNGLTNLRRRMEGTGGDFAIESKLAVGTTVTLRLPVATGATGAT